MTAESPTPDDVRLLRVRHGLTQEQACELVHVTVDAWSRWEAAPKTARHRVMPPGLWELIRIKVGEATLKRAGRAARKPRPAIPKQLAKPKLREAVKELQQAPPAPPPVAVVPVVYGDKGRPKIDIDAVRARLVASMGVGPTK